VRRLTRELDRQHRLVQEEGILRVGGQRLSLYRFRHNLFQSYLYDDLGPTERELLHEDVGNALEALYGEQADEIVVQLAWHFEKAGVREKAGHYLRRAGEQARRQYAYEEAVAYLSRALELLETLPETPERARRELDLQITLGVPLVHTRGHGAPEVEVAYARAQELCLRVGDAAQRFQVLLGLRRYHFIRGELLMASMLGEQLLAVAQRLRDPVYVSRAHMMHGEILYWLGEFAQAREHCEAGIALYDPQQRRSYLLLYGNDPGVVCRLMGALALWHLGYPDQALTMSQEALAQARTLSYPYTLVFAHFFHAVLHHLCWEVGAVQEQVQEVLRLSEERGFVLFLACGTVLRGWSLVQEGLEPLEGQSALGQTQVEEGIGQICEGIAALRATGAAMTLPSSLALLAKAYAQVDKTEKALDLIDEGLRLVEENEERCWEPELYRLRGELMLRKEDQTEAEACFQLALGIARRQRARSWELRVAMSLSRLWFRQDKRPEARALLQGIYGWFSEGFGTADLVEARALLDLLA
jgi:predicted ATPase